jgi:hypothetical protein
MTPTPRLRFVRRKISTGKWIDGSETIHTQTVLQQWWANDPIVENDFRLNVNGEWHDVPVEIEQ